MYPLILFGVWLVLAVLLSSLLGRVLLRPIRVAVQPISPPRRFLLGDFLWLFLQLQLALGALVGYVPKDARAYFRLLLGVSATLITLGWAGAVSTLSRAGIESGSRRAVFILFVWPGLVGLMVSSVVFLTLGVVGLVSPRSVNWVPELTRLTVGQCCLIAAATSVVLFPALWRAIRWVAAERPNLS